MSRSRVQLCVEIRGAAVPSAAACRTDHVVALLGGALAASIYHVSCGSIMLWNSAQKHWSPPPHGKMQAVRRWIRSALHPAEHALEASSWSPHGVRFSSTEESNSRPSELGWRKFYYSSKRTDTAERTVMPDARHSHSILQARSLQISELASDRFSTNPR